MIYRDIGKTGMKAGIIGLGAEHLEGMQYSAVNEVVSAACENGMNIMDVFMAERTVRENLAKALGDKRKDFIIQGHIGSVMKNNQCDRTRELGEVTKYAEEFLRIFGYMDIGMMFYVDTEKDFKECFETGFIDYVQKLKKDGYIRAIGFSSHNPTIAMKVIETGVAEVMMFSINPAFDMIPPDYDINDIFGEIGNTLDYAGIEPSRARLYNMCNERGVAITVMKTLCAGKLLRQRTSPIGQELTVAQCIHYALTRPAVVSALIGCRTRGEVEEACRYLTLEDSEKDYSKIAASFKDAFLGKCVYCNHCLPCPVNINVAEVSRALDAAKVSDLAQGNPQKIYDALESKASSCIECGSCEKNCPFGVKITEVMKQAAQIFEM